MTLYFASDHAGFELKNSLLTFAKDILGYDVVDVGAFLLDTEDDYPDFIAEAAKRVSRNPHTDKAVILGGSGQGEQMVANKYPNVRAALYYGGSHDILTLSREHNDANILSLGARFLTSKEAQEALTIWLKTSFYGEERHTRRINKLNTHPK